MGSRRQPLSHKLHSLRGHLVHCNISFKSSERLRDGILVIKRCKAPLWSRRVMQAPQLTVCFTRSGRQWMMAQKAGSADHAAPLTSTQRTSFEMCRELIVNVRRHCSEGTETSEATKEMWLSKRYRESDKVSYSTNHTTRIFQGHLSKGKTVQNILMFECEAQFY